MAKFYAVTPNGDSAVLSISLQNFSQSLQQNGWINRSKLTMVQLINMEVN